MERDSGECFSDQPHVQAYIPQMRHRFFSYPLLACNASDVVEAHHMGWSDPFRSHAYYDMSQDVEFLLGGKKLSRPVLSMIGHWPPKA